VIFFFDACCLGFFGVVYSLVSLFFTICLCNEQILLGYVVAVVARLASFFFESVLNCKERLKGVSL